MEILLMLTMFSILFFIMFVRQNDFISPSFLFVAPLTVSVFICVLYKEKWLFNCEIKTFLLLTVGAISFLCGEQLGKIFSKRKIGYNEQINCDMSVSIIKIIIIILFSFIAVYLVYKEVSISVSKAGITYTLFSTSTKGLDGYSVSYIVSMTMNVISIISVFGIVILVNNYANKCLKKRDWLFIIPIISYMIIVLMQGQRGDLINIFVSTYFICFCINYKKQGGNAKKSIKFAGGFIKYILIVLVVFYSLRLTIAKPGQKELSFADTISGYIGAQIDLLNRFVSENKLSYSLFGYESFHDMYRFFEKIGFMNNLPEVIFKYRAYNGLGCNVFTFFRRPYVDFGLLGAWIVALLCGIVFGHFYYKYVRVRNGNHQFLVYMTLYAYFVNKVAMSFFDDYMTLLISANTVIKLILFVLINQFLYCKIKIVNRGC